ncbi:hypothetical protein NDNC_1070 [Candidatus Nasuia deltocephalinicola]|uniref:30S ribosomal protein S17 n=1 Tax=Candidatus Nasuia deltocephalincola TaxID=1160784 RepID=A0A974WMW6_9PROT|nr:30S ribosomal protein S17 [Candidatus Nasuia deltocephalinicola]BEH03941.1 hypothetical protein NDNC_1070 [Candidatus Nasuia deltocephalinicola]
MNNIIFGKVLSCFMNKTVIVLIKKKKNKKFFYSKLIFIFIKIYAHDNFNLCKNNDFVYVIFSKPKSKKKFWKVINII